MNTVRRTMRELLSALARISDNINRIFQETP